MALSRDALLKIAPVVTSLRGYHRHKIMGAASVPKDGPAIFAVNHSLASYDIALLMAGLYELTNRIPRSLIDKLFYKVPAAAALMEAFGSQMGTHENALKLLAKNHLVVLAPGGMRESLRPSREKHKVLWKRRKGFIKLSIESGAPIILAACPAADDIYDVVPSYITAWAYRTLKIPIFFIKGWGLTPIPKPVELTHYLSEPIYPPKKANDPIEYERQVDDFHKVVCEKMSALMKQEGKVKP